MSVYNTSELYVIVADESSEICGIYDDESRAISDCQTMNLLGDYTCLTLEEHLENLWTVIRG